MDNPQRNDPTKMGWTLNDHNWRIVIKWWSRYGLIPIGNTPKGGVLNDLGYSNVSGNTRFNESKLDEVRKVCDANQ